MVLQKLRDVNSPTICRVSWPQKGLLLVVDIELLIGDDQTFDEWSSASQPNEKSQIVLCETFFDGAGIFVRAACKNAPHLKPQIKSWLDEHYGICTLVDSFKLDSLPPDIHHVMYLVSVPPPALPSFAAENPCLTAENTLVKVNSREAAQLAEHHGFNSFTSWDEIAYMRPPRPPLPPTTNRQFLSAS